MHKKLNLLVFASILFFLSCESAGNRKDNLVATVDSSPSYSPKALTTDTLQPSLEEREKEHLGERKEIEEWERMDSIRLDKILIEALDILTKNIDKNIFDKEYKYIFDNESDINIKIDLGFHFVKHHPHVIIHRETSGNIYIDIYAKKDKAFHKVLSHKEWSITYVSDTIRDVNGDGYEDFVVNGYGSAGCCLKAYSLVYLFRPNNSSFSDYFDFLNPTFSPQEKIIRGVCYGHPEYTELYKYKWNGESVDTLEYVYYERDKENQKTGAVVIAKNRPYHGDFKILKRLKTVPKEYENIIGYDWFTGEVMKEDSN